MVRWCRLRRLGGGVGGEELGEEAAVSVAEDEGAFAGRGARGGSGFGSAGGLGRGSGIRASDRGGR